MSEITDADALTKIIAGLPMGGAVDQAFDLLLEGPGGDLDLGGFEAGYIEALSDLLRVFGTIPLPEEVSNEARVAVSDDRRTMSLTLKHMIKELLPENPIADLLRKIFGDENVVLIGSQPKRR